MVQATASADVELPAGTVWAVIGKFDEIRLWAGAVTDERAEDDPGGPIRVLTMGNGAVVREQLVAQDEHSFSYRVLEGGSNLDAVSTIAVVPTGPGSSRIELSSDFRPAPGVAEEEALARQAKFLRGNVKAMQRALGVADS